MSWINENFFSSHDASLFSSFYTSMLHHVPPWSLSMSLQLSGDNDKRAVTSSFTKKKHWEIARGDTDRWRKKERNNVQRNDVYWSRAGTCHTAVRMLSACPCYRKVLVFTAEKTNESRQRSEPRQKDRATGRKIPANPSWESSSARTHPLREYTSLAPVSSEEHLHCRALVREGTCSLISLNAHLAYTWGTLSLSLTRHLWDLLPSPEHLGDFLLSSSSLNAGTFIDFQNTSQMTKPPSHRDITRTQCRARGLMEAHSALWQTDYLSRGLSADWLQGIQNEKRKGIDRARESENSITFRSGVR